METVFVHCFVTAAHKDKHTPLYGSGLPMYMFELQPYRLEVHVHVHVYMQP